MSRDCIRKGTFFRSLILAFAVSSLAGCVNGQKVVVSLEDLAGEHVSIHDVFSCVEYIPLERSPLSQLVPNGRYICAFGDSLIAVLDLFSDYSIRVFDDKGHFKTRISRQGRGEGRYGLAYDLLFDEPSGLLVVLDPTGKIIRYSVSEDFAFHDELSFLGPIKAAHNICKLSEDTYLLFSRSEKYQLYVASFMSGKTVPIRYGKPDWLMFSPFMAASSPLYSFGGKAHYFSGIDGEVFTVDEHGMRPYIRWNLGDYQLREKALPAGKSGGYYQELFTKSSYRYATQFSAMQETDRFVFAEFAFRNQRNLLIYDKEAKGVRTFHRTEEGVRIPLGHFRGDTMYRIVSPDYLHLYLPPALMPSEKPQNHVLLKYTLR